MPIERAGNVLVDVDGECWRLTRDALVSVDGDRTYPRMPGHHGPFFAFRSRYETVDIGPD
jgi:hypothetical protein